MTAAEADELVCDLERIGVQLDAVVPRTPLAYYEGQDEWEVRAWCLGPAHFYFVTDSARFCQAARYGLSGVLPRGALDRASTNDDT